MKTKNESLRVAHTRGVARTHTQPADRPTQRRPACDRERARARGTFAPSTLDSSQTTPESYHYSYHSQLLSLDPPEFWKFSRAQPLVTPRVAACRAAAWRSYAGHQRSNPARRSGRYSSRVPLPTPSSDTGLRDELEMATAVHGRPRWWRSRPDELELLWSQPATVRASRDYHKPSHSEGWSRERRREADHVQHNRAAAYRGGTVGSAAE